MKYKISNVKSKILEATIEKGAELSGSLLPFSSCIECVVIIMC